MISICLNILEHFSHLLGQVGLDKVLGFSILLRKLYIIKLRNLSRFKASKRLKNVTY